MRKIIKNLIGGCILTAVILGIFAILGILQDFLLNNPFWFGVFIALFFVWFYQAIKKEFDE